MQPTSFQRTHGALPPKISSLSCHVYRLEFMMTQVKLARNPCRPKPQSERILLLWGTRIPVTTSRSSGACPRTAVARASKRAEWGSEGWLGKPYGALVSRLSLAVWCFVVCFFEVKKQNGEIKMNIKAYNGRCVVEWLAHSLRSAASQPGTYNDERLPLAALAMWLGS